MDGHGLKFGRSSTQELKISAVDYWHGKLDCYALEKREQKPTKGKGGRLQYNSTFAAVDYVICRIYISFGLSPNRSVLVGCG
jgi:hypothetical protein